MGSEIITALAEQKGGIKTNPDSVVPEVSKPIQQTPVPFRTNPGTTKPIQQITGLRTAASLGGTEFSTPIQQLGNFVHAPTFPAVDQDHVIQQILTITATHPNSTVSPKPKTPIEQVDFVTANQRDNPPAVSRVIQQFLTDTAGSSVSRPVEQKPVIGNTIQITQFDFVALIFPACNSIKNPVNTNILWRIRDFGFPFNVSSLIFTVDGIQVQNRSEFVVTSLPAGLQIFYDPPQNFDFDKLITVTITISDTADPPNTFFLRCNWQTAPDVRPPIFRNISPACNSTDVDVLAPISFDVLDLGEGVNADSIILSVEGITVCSGVTLEPITEQAFVTISGIPQGATATGYHVEYQHPQNPFRFGSEVTVAFQASDLAPEPNHALFICCFSTEESTEPLFVGPAPEPCDSFVDNRTGLSFEVYGVEHGIDISTLEVRVDNKLRKVFVRPRLLRTD